MEYVVVYVDSELDQILVVEKDRPAWQKGRLNLVGGKIEEQENVVDAAIRELEEESGLIPSGTPELFGRIYGNWGTVWCVKVPVEAREIQSREGETENVCWKYWDDLKNDSRLIPNLKVVISLIRAGIKGWKIEDNNNENTDFVVINISIPKKGNDV